MKYKKLVVPAWVAMSLLMGGVASANDGQDKRDMEYCQQEAEGAGMVDEMDIQEYIQQCMDELRLQNEDQDPDRGYDGDHGGDRDQ